MADWTDRRVTVLGLGKSGCSAATYLAKRGARVFLSDGSPPNEARTRQAEELKALGVQVELGQHSQQALSFGQLVITSPGIPPSAEVMQRLRAANQEVICDVELAYRESRTPIIAVTGTNGKSTTCALISHLLTRSGRSAPACGNFGVPILEQLDSRPDFLVVEVSSYQLTYCSALSPLVSVWLNLTPDHLDWHGGLTGYIQAKQKLFAGQRPNQFAVLNEDDPIVATAVTGAQIFPFSVKDELDGAIQGAFIKDEFLAYRLQGKTRVLCAPEELQIRGRHNLENVLAAISAAVLVGLAPEEIEAGLKEFTALEHRLEYVATVDGVAFYNDSKATNTASAIKALESFPKEKIVLIAGGRDKGTSLDEFVQAVKEHASAVVLLGEAKQRFSQALLLGGFTSVQVASTMEEAIAVAGQLKLGPVVLSPACASFDMFKDYEDRGRVFKHLVHARLKKLASSG